MIGGAAGADPGPVPNSLGAAWRAAVLVAIVAVAGCDDPLSPQLPPGSAVDISAGDFHTCALDDAGAAYCWGSNAFGQLGTDVGDHATVPVRVSGGPFASISAGHAHTCAITYAGEAWCWGRGASGQLGTDSNNDADAPRRVSGGHRFSVISAGHEHTCAVATDGVGYCWGSNEQGQIGTTSSGPVDRPVAIRSVTAFQHISAGHSHSCGVAAGPEAVGFCWGGNARAQLGLGTFQPKRQPARVTGHRHPFASITAGFQTNCAINAAGQAFCWGDNLQGQLGLGTTGGEAGNPQRVVSNILFSSIDPGEEHMGCGVSTEGTLRCWGRQPVGLDRGRPVYEVDPTPRVILPVTRYVQVAVGLRHACARTIDGEVQCWGVGTSGQLGNGTRGFSGEPEPVLY